MGFIKDSTIDSSSLELLHNSGQRQRFGLLKDFHGCFTAKHKLDSCWEQIGQQSAHLYSESSFMFI